MNIYIACSLTHVPRSLFTEYSQFIHALAKGLVAQGHSVKYALLHSDPQLAEMPFTERAKFCYLWDRKMVEEADFIVAEASFPSTGLGIELQIAESKQTPILLCFHDYGSNQAQPVEYCNPDHSVHHLQIGKGHISLMALGLPVVIRVIDIDHNASGINVISEAIVQFKVEDRAEP